MDVGLLFSGGKDSSLAGVLLDAFYDVTLVTVHFGVSDDWRYAERTAAAIDLPFERFEIDREIAIRAVDQIIEDGFPRNGLQQLHLTALEEIAHQGFSCIADGTRRDDRVPTVSRAQAQQLEDRYGIQYLSPLAGFGRRAVDDLVDRLFEVEVGPSELIDRADYEAELRMLIAERVGEDAIGDIFPAHEQSAVIARR